MPKPAKKAKKNKHPWTTHKAGGKWYYDREGLPTDPRGPYDNKSKAKTAMRDEIHGVADECVDWGQARPDLRRLKARMLRLYLTPI